jgi:hypothetical protein
MDPKHERSFAKGLPLKDISGEISSDSEGIPQGSAEYLGYRPGNETDGYIYSQDAEHGSFNAG